MLHVLLHTVPNESGKYSQFSHLNQHTAVLNYGQHGYVTTRLAPKQSRSCPRRARVRVTLTLSHNPNHRFEGTSQTSTQHQYHAQIINRQLDVATYKDTCVMHIDASISQRPSVSTSFRVKLSRITTFNNQCLFWRDAHTFKHSHNTRTTVSNKTSE
jgi:hypothetical protein